ncbi:MAG TPA: hypothetical protein VK718_03640 [Ferruginibacter sp.]|jgi:hypothetical protein|nr:hypothetical protein [Ferruginibacter sp.]
METKMIAANTEETVWKKITADLAVDNPPLEYHVVIYQDAKKVFLDIDIDPGGGFESGYESTMLRASLPDLEGFKFALHHENFIDKVGKLFGMQDVVIGYPEFDKELIIKTNDAIKVKSIFKDKSARQVFQSLSEFTLHTNTKTNDNDTDFLELVIERGILDTAELRDIYAAFVTVLSAIDPTARDTY